MSDIINRVADALAKHVAVERSPNWRDVARDAIEAMREPTKEMIDAAWADAMGEDAGDVWRAMIDAALKAKSPGA